VIGVLIAGLLAASAMLLGAADKAAAATVDSISPSSGSALGGETLTINGSGFTSDYGDYIPLDYIQFYKDTAASAYPFIDTGIELSAATKVTVTYMVTDYNSQNIWGALGGTEIRLLSDGLNTTVRAYQSLQNNTVPLANQFAFVTASSGIITVTAGNGMVNAALVSGTGTIGAASSSYTPVGDGGNIMVGSRQMGYFTGRIYGFSIVSGMVGSNNNVSFNGIPAYGPYTSGGTTSNQYGLYDTVSGQFFVNNSKNSSSGAIQGRIWGPGGVNAQPPQPPSVTVDFNGVDSHGVSVGAPCLPLTIVSSTQATCPVPPSMLGGDGSGSVQVKVTVTDSASTTSATFPYTYEGDGPALLSATPDKGPMPGGELVNLTGKKFVTLLGALQFSGATIDPPPGTRPAAWTVNDQTVYGFVDPATGALTPATEGDGVVGLINGQVFPVAPTTVMFGQVAASAVTVSSLTTMTVVAPPHDPATVAVTIDKNGLTDSLADAYSYVAVGQLEVTMEGWACPANATLTDIQTSGVCQLIPDGGYAVSRSTVTWLYTVTYVSKGLDGTLLDPSQGELTDVSVTDAKLGQVCTVATLPLNTPYPCVASGPITPS